MEHDRMRSGTGAPAADAIRDAVRDEDPARWGHHRASSSTTAPVAGDAAAATYVPPRSTVVASRERIETPAARAEPPVDRPRFSIGATFLGWSVAAFFTVVFSAVALTFAGGSATQDGTLDLGNLALASLIGYLVAAFFAYLIGGYAAGRISLWHGTWHGLGTVAWAVLFAVLGVLAGVYLADVLEFGVRIDATSFGVGAILAILGSLIAMCAGGALGGRLGERYHEARHRAASRRELGGSRPL